MNKLIYKRLDLTDFSSIDDSDAISEDGLHLICKKVSEMEKKGWRYVQCERDLFTPEIIKMTFKKDEGANERKATG